LHVKNTVTLLESLKCNPGQNEGRFISNTFLPGIYQDVHLHGLNDTARFSIESEKENISCMGLNTWKNEFLIRESLKDPQQSLTLLPGQLEVFEAGVNEVVALAEHFKKQLSPTNKNEDCMQTVHNEWYEFKFFGKEKKLTEVMELALSNNERFPVLGQLLSTVCLLPVSTVCCERGFSLMNLVKNKF
jgi:hypothetical protein